MKYQILSAGIDLNDPITGFEFASAGQDVTLSFTDWRNMSVTVEIVVAYFFACFSSNGYQNLPDGKIIEIVDSERIAVLRQDGITSKTEDLHHYIISTNEDQWCEAVAVGLKISGQSI